jgi:hypothetical protein
MRRALAILLSFTRRSGYEHPHHQIFSANYTRLLQGMGKSEDEISVSLEELQQAPDETPS